MRPEKPTKNVTLNAKGQLVIPKWLRKQYDWEPGTVLALRPLAAGVMLQKVSRKTGNIKDLYGILKYDGPAKTLQDMDDAITKEVKARRASGRY